MGSLLSQRYYSTHFYRHDFSFFFSEFYLFRFSGTAGKAPKPDAIKVACIGNSITDGHGIDLAPRNGYPAQLQRILGNGYNVKNFGVSARTMLNKGDYPYMNELAWRDALAFKPDIVIIKLGTNDSKPENWQYNADFRKAGCRTRKPAPVLPSSSPRILPRLPPAGSDP